MSISSRILRYFKPSYLRRRLVRDRNSSGFSLIEVALALGITSFASTFIIGMTLMGLSTFRRAMDNTVQSSIVQNLTNEIFLTDFKQLRRMSKSQAAVYYFDADGTRLATPDGALYTADISFTDLSNATANHPLGNLTPGAGTTALISITRSDTSKDRFFVMVGNNQQVSSSTTPATW
ncbi:MAG: Verru_Chthon cassette protein B [Candidatus Methylacidiphilales bacterium]|nr:Verru_Chthon cassette protein B [Candidatus Methylacidiphilales bacterium]